MQRSDVDVRPTGTAQTTETTKTAGDLVDLTRARHEDEHIARLLAQGLPRRGRDVVEMMLRAVSVDQAAVE